MTMFITGDKKDFLNKQNVKLVEEIDALLEMEVGKEFPHIEKAIALEIQERDRKIAENERKLGIFLPTEVGE